MDAFDQYLDEKATINILSTLDQYGLIHITGHGLFRNYKNNEEIGLIENKRTYLLTGEIAEVDKTFGKYYTDILAKDIIVVSYKPDPYSDERKNRYWVSPKYVGDRNTFPENEVFLYLGICNGSRGFWRNKLGENNGISAVIFYDWSVYPHWEYKWAMKLYQKMCDTSKETPMTIRDCRKEIVIKEEKGYYDWGYVWELDKNIYVSMKSSGNRDFTFWQPTAVIENINFGYQKIEWATDVSCFSPGPAPTLMSHDVYHKYTNANVIIKENNYSLA